MHDVQDHDGNIVHHFNIPGRHSRLTVDRRSARRVRAVAGAARSLGAGRVGAARRADGVRRVLGAAAIRARSRGRPPLLDELAPRARASSAATIRWSLLRRLDARASTTRFEYSPKSTRVDSPIDEALRGAAGRLPGLRAHHDRARAAARHPVPLRQRLPVPSGRRRRAIAGRRDARVGRSAGCPDLGWVGFDPTNNLDRRRSPHPRGGRPRLRRRAADARRLQGRRARCAASWRSPCASAPTGQGQAMAAHEVPTHMPWVSREVPSSLPRPDLVTAAATTADELRQRVSEITN